MLRRLFLRIALAAVIVLALATPALAGGWAVVTLDRLPAEMIAGQPFDIGFMVRQHGIKPISGLTPRITATRAAAAQSFTVTAKQQGVVGHYAAALTFPNAGTWDWSIDAFGFAQPMPALTVVATAPSNTVKVGASFSLPLAAGIAGLIVAAGALLVSLRTRARGALTLVLAGALIGVTGFASAANDMTHIALPTAPSAPPEIGQALFLAKGCIVCHRHDAVREARKELGSFSIGPNLTKVKADPDYLRRWLKDPSAVKPGTGMPTLGLSATEIETLIAFLNAD